jgi:hypothetical protein
MQTESPHSEHQREEVVEWRRRRLLDAGFPPPLATVLAADVRVDLHALFQLVERGCPPALAARILAPDERESAAPR